MAPVPMYRRGTVNPAPFPAAPFLPPRHTEPRWHGAGKDAACSKAGAKSWLRATGFVLIKEESIRLQDIQPPGASDYFFLLLLFFLNVLLLPPGKS